MTEMLNQVQDDGVLCFVADIELVDVFGHVGIRYDFRAAGAVADEAADVQTAMKNVQTVLLGAMDIDNTG